MREVGRGPLPRAPALSGLTGYRDERRPESAVRCKPGGRAGLRAQPPERAGKSIHRDVGRLHAALDRRSEGEQRLRLAAPGGKGQSEHRRQGRTHASVRGVRERAGACGEASDQGPCRCRRGTQRRLFRPRDRRVLWSVGLREPPAQRRCATTDYPRWRRPKADRRAPIRPLSRLSASFSLLSPCPRQEQASIRATRTARP